MYDYDGCYYEDDTKFTTGFFILVFSLIAFTLGFDFVYKVLRAAEFSKVYSFLMGFFTVYGVLTTIWFFVFVLFHLSEISMPGDRDKQRLSRVYLSGLISQQGADKWLGEYNEKRIFSDSPFVNEKRQGIILIKEARKIRNELIRDKFLTTQVKG